MMVVGDHVVHVLLIVYVMVIDNVHVQTENVVEFAVVQDKSVQIMLAALLTAMADNVVMMAVVAIVVDVQMVWFVRMDNV
jgi:hypothetical protein